MKKRILMVNEASYLATGYSVYGLELLTRLYNTDKYEVAELGAFGQDNDPRIHNIPWKFYPNQPPDNTSEAQHFLARQSNIFGEWRFDKTCLDFKPHIVFAVRDYWMDEFIGRSPFRPYFKWVEMPTVDSAPQDEEWIASYVNADAVLTYSEFGYNTLLKEGSGLIKLVGIASPGANFNDFPYITDKSKAKQEMGIPQDAFIIGTVMRNQERKLYPDLIKSFAMLLEQAPSELAKKSYLYLHTGYPDVGWKIPTLLKRYGILSKTLFTYFCNPKNGGCGVCYPSFYQDARAFCRNCGQYLAVTPGVHMGVSRQALGKILGIFDVYVQYANCEGYGIPLVEAGATGAICFAVDYSAMHDIIKKINGYAVRPINMFCDPRTHSERAMPDNQDFVNKLIEVMKLSPKEKQTKSVITAELVRKHCSWDNTVKVWEQCFDNLTVLNDKQSWQSPSRITQPNMNIPQGLNNTDFVNWTVMNIAGRPELLNSYISMRMIRDLTWGASQQTGKWADYSRQDVINEMTRACEQKNAWEKVRLDLENYN